MWVIYTMIHLHVTCVYHTQAGQVTLGAPALYNCPEIYIVSYTLYNCPTIQTQSTLLSPLMQWTWSQMLLDRLHFQIQYNFAMGQRKFQIQSCFCFSAKSSGKESSKLMLLNLQIFAHFNIKHTITYQIPTMPSQMQIPNSVDLHCVLQALKWQTKMAKNTYLAFN